MTTKEIKLHVKKHCFREGERTSALCNEFVDISLNTQEEEEQQQWKALKIKDQPMVPFMPIAFRQEQGAGRAAFSVSLRQIVIKQMITPSNRIS